MNLRPKTMNFQRFLGSALVLLAAVACRLGAQSEVVYGNNSVGYSVIWSGSVGSSEEESAYVSFGTSGYSLSWETGGYSSFGNEEKLMPGRTYYFYMDCSSIASGHVTFVPSGGVKTIINGVPNNRLEWANGGPSGPVEVRIELPGGKPSDSVPSMSRGGQPSSIVSDKPVWYFSLGMMRDGRSAGAVGIREWDFGDPNTFHPAGLVYDSIDDTEVEVVRINGVIRQIYSPAVFVDVPWHDPWDSSGNYEILVFPHQKNGETWEYGSTEFVKYKVSRITSTTNPELMSGSEVGMKIERWEDGQYFFTTLVNKSGGSTWHHRDWRQNGAPNDTYTETIFSSSTSATVNYYGYDNVSEQSSAIVLTGQKTFASNPLGRQVTAETWGSSGSTLSTVTNYSTVGGGNRYVESFVQADGNWGRTVWETNTDLQWYAQPLRTYSPWKDGPSAPSAANTGNSRYEDFEYYWDWKQKVIRPVNRFSRAPGGALVGKTSWIHDSHKGTLNSGDAQHDYREEVVRTYWGSGASDYVVTTTRYYIGKADSPYYKWQDKPLSQIFPDGRKDAYYYHNGTWNPGSRTFSASQGGVDRRIVVFHGQQSGGSTLNSFDGLDGDSVGLQSGQSTATETIVDGRGLVVFRAENVVNGSPGLARISAVAYEYDSHGRLTKELDLIRTLGGTEYCSTRTWEGDNVKNETGWDGVRTEYTYNTLLRLVEKKVGAGTPIANYPVKTFAYKYDGAGRTVESATCTCSTQQTYFDYDPAGRLEVKSEPSPNSAGGPNLGLMSYYSYPSLRSSTVTGPDGGTTSEERFLDGQVKKLWGSTRTQQEFDYELNSIGLKTTITTSGFSAASEEQRDWLGRVIWKKAPTPGNNDVKSVSQYNSAGQLVCEKTLNAANDARLAPDRRYEYDSLGRLVREGLDIDENGNLDSANDRVTAYDMWYYNDGNGWVYYRYVKTKADVGGGWVHVSGTHTRLTNFNLGSLYGTGLVVSDVASLDAAYSYRVEWASVDRGNRVSWKDVRIQGVGQYPIAKWTNGYQSSVLTASNVPITYSYDDKGRLATIASGSDVNTLLTTSYTYHGNTEYVSSVTSGGVTVNSSYAWNTPAGSRKVTTTESGDKKTHTLYNTRGQPWRVWGNAANPVEFAYDSSGRRVSMTTHASDSPAGLFNGDSWPSPSPAGRTTVWTFNARDGSMTRKKAPDDTYTDYQYTILGQVSYRKSAMNRETHYQYFDGGTTNTGDVSHRTQELRGIQYLDGTPSSWYTYRRTGQIATVQDVTGTRSFTYRGDFKLEREDLASGFYGSDRKVVPLYEDGSGGTQTGRLKGIELRTGGTTEAGTSLSFDATTGRISQVSGAGATFTYAYTPGTDWLQEITSGSFKQTRSLENNKRDLKKVENLWSGTNKATYDSTINARGLRDWQNASGAIPGSPSQDTFSYNDRGELAGSSNNVDANRSFTWTFDLAANRLEATQNGVTTTYNPNVVDQYSSIYGQNAESGISYDTDGNIAQDGTWYYGFDVEHRLWLMTRKDGTMTLTFQYDYLNRRVKKVVRYGGYGAAVAYSTKYVWSGQRLLAELDGGTSESGTSLAKSYVWGVDFSDARGVAGGAGGLLAVRQGGQTYFPTYDTLGNVTGYLNSGNGNVEASYQYNAFGQVLDQGGNWGDFAFGFATQYTDRESGLIYYGARYYNPKHGRFISRDPIEEAGGLNLNAFVQNSPSNLWDAWGLVTTLPEFTVLSPRCGVYYEAEEVQDGDSKCIFIYQVDDCGESGVWRTLKSSSCVWSPAGTEPAEKMDEYTVWGSRLDPQGSFSSQIANVSGLSYTRKKESDCEKWVKSLLARVEVRGADADKSKYLKQVADKALGEMYMMAKGMLFPKHSVTGFRDELTEFGQDSDVYRHSLGAAAARLSFESGLDDVPIVIPGIASGGINLSGGRAGYYKQQVDDYWQQLIGVVSKNGSAANLKGKEGRAESAGNSAGWEAGLVLSSRIDGSKTQNETEAELRKLFCK